MKEILTTIINLPSESYQDYQNPNMLFGVLEVIGNYIDNNNSEMTELLDAALDKANEYVDM